MVHHVWHKRRTKGESRRTWSRQCYRAHLLAIVPLTLTLRFLQREQPLEDLICVNFGITVGLRHSMRSLTKVIATELGGVYETETERPSDAKGSRLSSDSASLPKTVTEPIASCYLHSTFSHTRHCDILRRSSNSQV